ASYAARLGQWGRALPESVRAMEMQRRIGDHATGRASLAVAAIALCRLGALEPAALLLGKSKSMESTFFIWGLDLIHATETNLRERLGEQRVAELAARGAALSFSDAVDYAQSEAERGLAATPPPPS